MSKYAIIGCHYRKTNVDCGDNLIPAHWVADGVDSTGRFFTAIGDTEEEARDKLEDRLIEREQFLSLPDLTKLDRICSQDNILHNDLVAAVKLINNILQYNEERFENRNRNEY